MRILCLSSWWPEPANNGSRLRIMHLLRALAKQHEVHLIALAQEPETSTQQLESICVSAHAVLQPQRLLQPLDVLASIWRPEPASVRADWNTAFAALVREQAATLQPDLCVAFQLGVAPYTRLIGNVPRILEEVEVATIQEQYTRQPMGLRKIRAALTWHKHQRYITQTLHEFDAFTTVSAAELTRIQTLAPEQTHGVVIPNGADVSGSIEPRHEPEPDTLIYPGALSFDANFDAMVFFLQSIFPYIKAHRPNVRLRITGNTSAQQRQALPNLDGVEFTGYVADIRPCVARSWAEVVPLRIGGGTRLKVLEALALGTPVITTSKGIEGLELVPGQHVLVANTAADFAAATVRLLEHSSLRNHLRIAGLRIVRERYDWQIIGQQLNALVEAVAQR